ncbi:uncharacterized protein LOC132164712 isoform X2 [Corylus avellana]|uniref:uncharacterized protein LOC132164712 isoform X1 n=1 Tax=Corylus avellana TaxID=13451 RepID=UPI00286D523E|nr:uncharacterized protein LOC132164712 isoform X1 [Corylus avellana]XP_059431248.1 uncharacterized protein LOC132164712 isoform X2 [Corylus avellana]
MSEEEGEEVGTKKRRSARILELEEEKEKKKSRNKDQEEAKAKSISEEEEQHEGGPEEDHEEMEEQCPSTTGAAGEAPTVEEGTLEDVAVTFVASPCQQNIMDASQQGHMDTQSDQPLTDSSMHTPCPAKSSEPSELSVDTLTPSETSSSIRKKGRGPAKGLKLAKRAQETSDGKLDIEFSDMSDSAVGPNQRMFVDEVVQQMRVHTPLNVKKWAEVPQEAKDNIVSGVLRRWRIPDSPLRRASILKLANRRYRGWRAKLSKDYSKYDNDEDRRQNRPKEVSEKQWESLITYFGTDEFKTISDRNKENRSKQKTGKITGSKSFAAVSYDARDPVTGQQPNEYRTWLLCHRHPDGSWSDETARQIYERVTELITQQSQQEGEPLSPSNEDELFQSVLGSRPVHLRGQRRGLSQAQKLATVEVQMERDALEEKLGEMKQKLQEESAARTVIQAQLQAESAARAEMEARLQAESAARTAMEARLRAEFMVALDSIRSQASSSSKHNQQ